MTVFQLECFISVESHLSFSKAAIDKHVSQATISRQIASLEEEIGVKLFERDSHTVSPTPAGSMMAHYAPVFLEYQKTILNRVRDAAVSFSNHIRIGVGPYEHLLLRSPLVKLHETFPKTGIDLTSYTYYVLMTRYRNNVLDLILCNEACAMQMTDLKSVEIYNRNWQVAAAKNSHFWSLAPEDQGILKGQTLITLVNDSFDSVNEYFHGSCKGSSTLETNFLTTLFELVQADIGVAILPPFVRQALPEGIVMKDLLSLPFYQRFFALYDPSEKEPSILTLIDLCKNSLQF